MSPSRGIRTGLDSLVSVTEQDGDAMSGKAGRSIRHDKVELVVSVQFRTHGGQSLCHCTGYRGCLAENCLPEDQ